MSLSKPSDQVAVRDCQTQTLSPADLELEASVTYVRQGEGDQNLPNSTDTNKDRQEEEKPLNSTSAPGTGQIPGERQRKIEGQGKILPKSQSQIEGQADLELAAGNAYNHQEEPEVSATYVRKGEGDQPLVNSTDTNKDRHEGEKPLNSTSAPGKGKILDKSQYQIKVHGGNPGKNPNAPDDPNANVKKVAMYAFGAAAIGVGIFVVAPILMGITFAGPSITTGSAYMMSASASGSAGAISAGAGGVSAGAAAGVSFGGAAAITALYAAGEVTVGAVRYITRRENPGPTKDADTQTDLDESD